VKKSHSHRRDSIAAILGLISVLWLSSVFADPPFSSSPLGTQKVLVLPMEFAAGVACPNPNEACTVNQGWYSLNVGPPRNSPEQWQSLLNAVAGRWWQQATYGQSQYEFTVLRDPQTEDGWWPTPHTFQEYQNNPSIWGASKTVPYAMVPDETASVIQFFCSDPLLQPQYLALCVALPQYTHLIVLQNVHSFGDSTINADGSPYSIPTNSAVGNLVVHATAANEDGDDRTISAMLHELGHQAAEKSHYGDCSHYFSFTSFNQTTLPGRPIECITGWDVMGGSYSFSDFSGYSKVSRGILDLASTPTFDLIDGGPFAENYSLNPVEVAPTAANPGLIRLSVGDPSWPDMYGYLVECREFIGNDGSNAFPEVPYVSSIPETGILITNVHEYSAALSPSIPAHHVERNLSADPVVAVPYYINQATLKPGQSFNDPLVGATVQFVSYVQNQNGAPQCNVSVAHDRLLPPTVLARKILFAGNLRVHADLAQPAVPSSIPVDIAYNQILQATPTVLSSLPVVAPWVQHDNPLSVRLHNRSGGDIDSVQLAINIHQPALIVDDCAMNMGSASMQPPQQAQGGLSATLKHIPAGGSAVANLDWQPSADQSISIGASATGPANQVDANSSAAFQFHRAQVAAPGITSSFTVSRSAMCTGAQAYSIAPLLSLEDWNVQISPANLTLNPGEQADVSVTLTPSSRVSPGYSAQIPIAVRAPMQMLANTDPTTPSNFIPGIHYMAVGSMTVLARVTSGPGTVSLGCARGGPPPWSSNDSHPECGCSDTGLNVAGAVTPATPDSPVTIEYRSPDGSAFSHVVNTDQNSRYHDALGKRERDKDALARGDWIVQARWSGGDSNDPTESPAVVFHVRDGHSH
jgi:hypothetical protein